MLSRRDLIHAGCTIAAATLVPHFMDRAVAGMHAHGIAPSTGFNGGVTQTNTLSPDGGGWFFINWIKSGNGLAYLSPPTDPTAPTTPVLELDANGYPTSNPAGTGGVFTDFTIPPNQLYSGHWVLKWDGTGSAFPANFATTTISSTSNRFVFVNNDTSPNFTLCFIFMTGTGAAPNNLRNLRLCRSADEMAMDAGAVWLPEHLMLMQSAKPGTIRSLGWGGDFNGTNTSLIGLWAQRKPVGFVTYGGQRLNPAWCGGTTGSSMTTTNSGTDYTLAYSGFSLTDKVAVHLIWNVSMPNVGNSLVTLSWATTNGNAININWNGHGFANGNVVVFGNSTGAQVPPAALNSAQFYFVNVVDANNFTVSATSGGSAILANATTSGSVLAEAVPRININSTGLVPLTDFQTPQPSNIGSICGASPNAGLSTIVFDQTTNWFHIGRSDGSNPPTVSPGLTCGGPPEVFIDYCGIIGANPWLTAPFLTLTTGGATGGVTDYMTSWVTYAKNNYPWMKPLVEPYNETWNPTLAGLGTFYANTLGYKLWPTFALTDRLLDNAYGKWVSDLGQAISSIYGNDRTKYSMLCMAQAAGFHDPASVNINDARLTSALYVSVNGGQPAYKFCDRVGAACYYGAYDQLNNVNEIIDGFNYVITNAGNSAAQAAIAETYTATANNGTDAPYTLAYVDTVFKNIKTWGLGSGIGSTVPNAAGGNTVKGLCAYEGGWGPNVPIPSNNWTTNVSAAGGSITKANPCVLTMDTNSTASADNGSTGIPGNPGVVGQMINLQFVSGMTQINNTTLGTCTFNGTATISATNTLIVNQAVLFPSAFGAPPSPFKADVPYHVISTGLSSSAFQLSATKGGSAIVTGTSTTFPTASTGWFITAVGTSTITLDLDSSGFSTWTNASTGQITWTAAGVYSDILRLAANLTNAMAVNNAKMYSQFFALSGSGFTAEYPSNFLYFGNAGAWSVLYPNIFASLTPQWNSIVAAN